MAHTTMGLFSHNDNANTTSNAPNTTTGVTTEPHHEHHLGRDAALGAGAIGVAEHEHHKHQAAATDPTATTSAEGSHHHHLGRDAAVGAGAVGVAEHEHHKHHPHQSAAVGTTGATGVGPGAITDPATMPAEGNPLYPSPHAPVSDTVPSTGATAGATGAAAAATHSSQVTTSTGKSPSTQAMIGKVERVVGTVLHSDSLKAKGIAKEEEAASVKAQKAELVEAERLESHANLARDRAAAHAATGNVHGHAHDALGTYGAGPTMAGDTTTAGGVQGIGGAGTARPF